MVLEAERERDEGRHKTMGEGRATAAAMVAMKEVGAKAAAEMVAVGRAAAEALAKVGADPAEGAEAETEGAVMEAVLAEATVTAVVTPLEPVAEGVAAVAVYRMRNSSQRPDDS